ncbi:MAG: transporter substrate-binding domain-containing protein [Desulfobacterales bacterium]|nr:transporter substrate-binding domain-containing protein [Desulfobacterales bacterium]
MRKRDRYTHLLVLASWLVMILNATVYAETFHLAGDEDEAPFGYINDKKQFTGIFVDIIRESFRRMNLDVIHTPYPWARAQLKLKNREADGIITVVTPERLTFTVPSTYPLAKFEWVAFARKDHPRIDRIMKTETIAGFKGFRILDYLGDGWGEKYLGGLDVERSGSLSAVLKKLALGRGDVFIQPRMITRNTLRQLRHQAENNQYNIGAIVNSTKILDTREFKLLVAKASPHINILPRFDAALLKMKEDGTLQNIYNKYITD